MGLFKKRPKARIKLGMTFLGESISATAEGYLLFKEYDAADRKFYYWEEWELRGFNNYDSWIEYDHYARRVTLFEPLRPTQPIDMTTIAVGQDISFTDHRNNPHTMRVHEVSTGTVVRREGTLTYHVFEGDTVKYAESSGRYRYSLEMYNDKEFDVYKARTLSKAEQKQLLGKVITPWNWGSIWSTLFMTAFFVIVVVASLTPSYENYCTPKTVAPNTPATLQSPSSQSRLSSNTVRAGDEKVSEDSTQTCYRRVVYGGSSSGGGVGK